MKVAIGFDLKERKATLYQGNRKFHTTTIASICSAIIHILREPSKFANKTLHIHDFFITQRDLLAVAESVTGDKFEVTEVSAEEIGKKALEAIKRGEFNQQNSLGVLKMSIFGEDISARWDENDDSVSLGLGGAKLAEEVGRLVKA